MQIFNDKKKRIGTLSGFKDREIITTLDSGDKELSFNYPAAGALVDLLKEEYYIRTKTDEYVIKAVANFSSLLSFNWSLTFFSSASMFMRAVFDFSVFTV